MDSCLCEIKVHLRLIEVTTADWTSHHLDQPGLCLPLVVDVSCTCGFFVNGMDTAKVAHAWCTAWLTS